MSNYQKVIWSEGMFIRPQHFQQQERYFENNLIKQTAALNAYAYGCLELKIDQSLLDIGKFNLSQARGILPDGTRFDFPYEGEGVEAIDIPENTSDKLVYLALPLQREGILEVCNPERAPKARLKTYDRETIDHSTGTLASANIMLGRWNYQLLLEGEDMSQFTALPIALIKESQANGRIILDNDFIAPSLNCHSDGQLSGYLRELTAILQHRSKTLANLIGNLNRSNHIQSLSNFLLLRILNQYQAVFEHYLQGSLLHPEQFYLTALQLRAELSTFTLTERRPQGALAYQHKQLQQCFTPLLRDLRIALNTLQEPLVHAIELNQDQFGILTAVIQDKDVLENSRFIISAEADISADLLVQELPKLLKIGPSDQIKQLINLQLPGINLRLLPVAPAEVPYNAKSNYFLLETENEILWQKVKTLRSVSFHLNGELPNLSLSLWAIKG